MAGATRRNCSMKVELRPKFEGDEQTEIHYRFAAPDSEEVSQIAISLVEPYAGLVTDSMIAVDVDGLRCAGYVLVDPASREVRWQGLLLI